MTAIRRISILGLMWDLPKIGIVRDRPLNPRGAFAPPLCIVRYVSRWGEGRLRRKTDLERDIKFRLGYPTSVPFEAQNDRRGDT